MALFLIETFQLLSVIYHYGNIFVAVAVAVAVAVTLFATVQDLF